MDKKGPDFQMDVQTDKDNIFPDHGLRSLTARISPKRILLITIAGISLGEAIAMTVVWLLPPMAYPVQILLDALIMVALVFPLLHHLIFRILLGHIAERERAESQLRLLSAALEAAANGVIITGPRGNIRWANPAFTQMTGYTYAEVLGQNPRLLKSGQHDANFYRLMWGTILSGHVWHGEIINRRKDGSLYFEEQTITPLVNNKGEITNYIAIQQEISERKQAEQALIHTNELLERFFSSIDTLIAYMDRDFNFLRVNDAYAKSGGHPPEFFVGKNHFDLYPHEENQAIFRQVVITGEPVYVYEKPFEYSEYPERGVTYWDLGLQPVKGSDGVIQGLVLSLVDVTERKQAEMKLAHQNQELRELSEAERKQRVLAEGLTQSVIALTTSLQLEDVLNTVLDQIRRVIPFSGANICLLEGKTVRVGGYSGYEGIPDGAAAMQSSYDLDDFPLFRKICSTLQPVLIPEALEDPDWRVAAGMEWVRSYLGVPLTSDGRVAGIINISSDQPGSFNQETGERLMAFAAPAALAVHNAQLYKAELTARRAAETLKAAAQAMTQTLNLEAVIDALLEYMDAITHAETTDITLLEGESRLVRRAARGYERWANPDQLLPIDVDTQSYPLLKRLISSRESVLVPDTALSPEWQVLPGMDPIRSWLGVPMVAGEKVIGVVGLGNTKAGYFTYEHIRWAEALVGQAAMAIQNAWLFEQVRASGERLQSLSRRLVEIQENERRYIASELHDEVGQALTAIMVGLQLIERGAERPEVVRAEVNDMGQVLASVIENLHRLAMDLRPASLDYLGLEAALRQHIEVMSEKLGLKIQFAMTVIGERLPANIEIAFYRIVQEALNNVARHARATQVDVLITQRDDCLVLLIEDDGIGFNPGEAMKGKRLGLNGMRERAEMLDGKLLVESIPGKGSTVLVEVPYASPNSHRR